MILGPLGAYFATLHTIYRGMSREMAGSPWDTDLLNLCQATLLGLVQLPQ